MTSNKAPISKALLRNLYENEHRTSSEIAKLLKCSKSTVFRNLRKYSILRRHEPWNKFPIRIDGESKQCSKCKKILPLTDFGWTDRDGFRTECNPCKREYNRLYRRKNKDLIKKRDALYRLENKDKIMEWREQNKERIKERQRQYREMNHDEIRRKQKMYYELNREELLRRKRKYSNSVKSIHRRIKHGASKRRIPFNIQFSRFEDWYNQKAKVCEYCEIDEKTLDFLGKRWTNRNKNGRMTIDRINSKGIYELENITLACFTCNNVKGNHLTFDDMKIIGKHFLKPKWQTLLKQLEKTRLSDVEEEELDASTSKFPNALSKESIKDLYRKLFILLTYNLRNRNGEGKRNARWR